MLRIHRQLNWKRNTKKEKSMKPSPLLQQRGIVVLLVLFLAACSPLIGSYSPTAYENATSLKAETLALMDKAGDSPSEVWMAKVTAVFEV